MAPDEIGILIAIIVFTVGGFALAHYAKKTREDDSSDNSDRDQK